MFLFEDGLKEAQWADVSPLLKNFNAQWRLAADARSASKQRVYVNKIQGYLFSLKYLPEIFMESVKANVNSLLMCHTTKGLT